MSPKHLSVAGLVIAFLYGIFHALGPGHGKTVIVGYFLGRGGSIRRGVAMAGWIALSHVVGAVTVVVGLKQAVDDLAHLLAFGGDRGVVPTLAL